MVRMLNTSGGRMVASGVLHEDLAAVRHPDYRRAVLQVLRKAKKPLTVAQIQRALERQPGRLWLREDVCRALDVLIADGQVNRRRLRLTSEYALAERKGAKDG